MSKARPRSAVTSRRKALKNWGSQSYVPPDEKDDRALKEALDLLRGTITDAAFPLNPKAALPPLVTARAETAGIALSRHLGE